MNNVEEMDKFLEKYNFPKLNQNWKKHMYPNVHRSTVYNSQDMETT